MTGHGIFKHNAFGIEDLTGYAENKVFCAKIQIFLVFDICFFGSNASSGSRDDHAQGIFNIVIDGLCGNFFCQTGYFIDQVVVGIKDQGSAVYSSDSFNEPQLCADIKAGGQTDCFIGSDFTESDDFGTDFLAASCGSFRKAFDTADRKDAAFFILVDDLNAFAVLRQYKAFLFQHVQGSADGIPGTAEVVDVFILRREIITVCIFSKDDVIPDFFIDFFVFAAGHKIFFSIYNYKEENPECEIKKCKRWQKYVDMFKQVNYITGIR